MHEPHENEALLTSGSGESLRHEDHAFPVYHRSEASSPPLREGGDPVSTVEEIFAQAVGGKLRRLAVGFGARVFHGAEASALGPHPTIAELPAQLRALADEIEVHLRAQSAVFGVTALVPSTAERLDEEARR